MRYKIIGCSVLSREISLLAARAQSVLDVTWIQQGLHNYPDLLRGEIQKEIDRAEAPPVAPADLAVPPEDYAAIILGFGLCSGAVAGLKTVRLPLVVPRTHDCIAILLGSHEHYKREFDAVPGTYWLSSGWVEQSTFPCGAQCRLIKDRYTVRYGEDNAEYLLRMKLDALRRYTRAALICWPELDRSGYRDRLAEVAAEFGWTAECVEGNPALLRRILDGDWNEHDVLICPPGFTIETDCEDRIMETVPSPQAVEGDRQPPGDRRD